MRIISGSRRGPKLMEFEGSHVRPTTDRVKESVFNLIQSYVSDARVLDMFSGSGALSMEAVSRGAKNAVCVDTDKRSVDIIRKNIASLRFEDKCRVVNGSCFDYVKSCREQFDVIFMDPPYNKGFIEPALSAVSQNNILSDDGIIVLESDNTDFNGEIKGLVIFKQKKYGRSYITIYKKDRTNENSSLSGQL